MVPFNFVELDYDLSTTSKQADLKRKERVGIPTQDGKVDQPDSKSRAAKNLQVIQDFQKNRAKQVLEQRKVFKSEYHQTGKETKQVDPQGAQIKYYTLSKKGMTTFVNNEPFEFIKIENWLAERSQFSLISQKKFFSNFRTWKILRMWRLNILSAHRELVTANLKAKLFIADAVFGKILLQHRANCKDLEKLRVLDLQQVSRDSFTLVDFQQR